MKSCDLVIGESGRAVLQADNGSVQVSWKSISTELSRLPVAFNDGSLSEEAKRLRVTGLLNTVILSEAASLGLKQGMAEQRGQMETPERQNPKVMIKRVMIRLCGYLFRLSVCILYILLRYLLPDWVTMFVAMGVQLLVTAGLIYIRVRAPDQGRHQSVQLRFIGPCLSDGICVSLKGKSKMIKCNVTICGAIDRNISARTNREGNSFLLLPLRVTILDRDGQNEIIEISVSKDGSQEEASGYWDGLHVEITGTLLLKRRDDKFYFNLFTDRTDPVASDMVDLLKGDMAFRGKMGKNIEERKDRNDKPYTMFSAFSIKKVDENFEYQWVRSFCFSR